MVEPPHAPGKSSNPFNTSKDIEATIAAADMVTANISRQSLCVLNTDERTTKKAVR